MARVISLGAPVSAPEQLRREQPYQHLETSPDTFGAAHARQEAQNASGLERASTEAFSAWKQNQDLQNEIVADDRVNQFNEAADKLLYTGDDALFTKQGQDYMNAYQDTAGQLQQLRTQYLSGLPNTTMARVDGEMRGYLQREMRMMGGRYDEAMKTYGANVNKSGADLDLRRIAANPNDEDSFGQYRDSLRNRFVKDLQLKGLGGDPDAIADAQSKADAAAWQARIDALLKTDPAGAKQAFASAPAGTFTGPEIERYQGAFDVADARAQRLQTKQSISDATSAILGGGSYNPSAGGGSSHPSAKDNFANHNYGNIKATSGGWESYPDAESGVQAVSDWLTRHYQQHGQDTIRKILNQPGVGYSPDSDNPGKNLVGDMAFYTGFDPDQKIDLNDPNVRAKVTRAILHQEGAPAEAFQTKAAGGDKYVRSDAAALTGTDAGTPNAPNQQGVVAPQAPIDKLRPDFESMEQKAYAIDNPDVQAGVMRNIQRAKSQWDLSTQADRRQLAITAKNAIEQRMMGQDGPDISEAQIRHLMPQDEADDLVGKLQDAKIYGQELTRINTQSLPDILNERARLTAAQGVPGIHDFTLRHQGADQYMRASEQVLKEMSTDPAGWMATRPELRDQAVALFQMKQPQHDEDMPAYTKAHEDYANKMLAAQHNFGLPDGNQHVLATAQAQGYASQIMSNPAGAHDLINGLQRSWGDAWPKVWNDIAGAGGLSTSYQAIGVLDPHYGKALAQGLADEGGGDGTKKGMQVWEDLFGGKAINDVKESVRGTIEPFITSMRNSGASGQQQDAMTHAVETLTFSLMAHGLPSPDGKAFGTLDQASAVDKATHALLDLYEFMPGATGGARVPTKQYDAVSQATTAMVGQLGPGKVQVPAGFGKPGQPTADDYFNSLRARPTWINEGDGLALIDNAGRHVLNPKGQPITVPFNVSVPAPQPAAPGATDAAAAAPSF